MLKRLFALTGFKIALGITLIVIPLYLFNAFFPTGSFLNLMDKKWVDYIMRDRGKQPHSDVIAIATIDHTAVLKYGRWPWSRARMAELINALNDYYKVSTVGFDIVFSEAVEDTGLALTEKYQTLFAQLNLDNSGRGREFVSALRRNREQLDGDVLFGKELAKKKNTILGYFFFTNKEDAASISQKKKEDSARRVSGSEVSLIQGSIAPGVIPQGLAVESNIQPIFAGGFLSGFFDVTPDAEDGTVRRVHVLFRYGDNVYPSLDLQMLRHYLKAQYITVVADENGEIAAIKVGPEKTLHPDRDGSILLNYKGPEKTFPQYSIYDIIEHKIPVEDLRDKIILVGATEKGVYDLRTVPVGVAYPGVEVHATLLDNMLTGTYFKIDNINILLTLTLILGLGLLLGFTLPHLRGIYGAVLAAVLLVVYTFLHRWMVNNWLSWTSYVYVVLLIVAVWGGVTLFRFLVTDKDKRFIKGAFQQYLAPEVINQLMENPDRLKLGGERQVVTAFFSDVQGFSTISEKLDPVALVQLMQEYLTEMSNIVMKYGGTIDKYIGDAIVAFFGAPVHFEDHATKAVICSLEMQTRLEEMRQQWRKDGRKEDMMLYQRIGLNTGPMVVGNMGSQSRFNYTMMGNAVNLAARLEGANKFYHTYAMCTEFTMEPAKDQVEFRELDSVAVKGVTIPVRVFELIGKKGEVPEDRMKGIAYFQKGLELYRKRQFEEATKYFQAVFKFIPEDGPAKEFVERCADYQKNPPDEHWDGSYHATEK